MKNNKEIISEKKYLELPFYDENKLSEFKIGDRFRIFDEITPSTKHVSVIEVIEFIPNETGYKIRMLKKDLEVEK